MANEILYLKLDLGVKVKEHKVLLKDISKLFCKDPHILAKAKTLKIITFREGKDKRVILSVLKIIEILQGVFPDITIENIGEVDVIIELEKGNKNKGFLQICKIVMVSAICFFGTAFTIMSFHNDININALFSQLYRMIIGKESDGYTILELSYSIGLATGIIIFFNHIGKKRLTKDPTPVEVKMRLYEQDVNQTLIETGNREDKTIDVD